MRNPHYSDHYRTPDYNLAPNQRDYRVPIHFLFNHPDLPDYTPVTVTKHVLALTRNAQIRVIRLDLPHRPRLHVPASTIFSPPSQPGTAGTTKASRFLS
jgi:hypothetical protein